MAARYQLALPALSTYFQAVAVVLIWVLLLPVDAQNRSDEVQTLLQFKEKNSFLWYGGGYWNDWKERDENTCAWAGVTCSNNFTVWALDFSGWTAPMDSLNSDLYFNSLDVNLDLLSNLRDLRHFDVSSNHGFLFHVGNLTRLTYLDLSSNGLLDFPSIWNMTTLAHLDLSFNSISGHIPPSVSSCRSLQFISLQQNNLSGEIPSLDGLKNLQFLNVAHNQLFGQFPKEIGHLGTLLSVDLSHNSLTGTIPALPNATDLVELKLDNNCFTKFSESWFVVANSSLRRLSASFNELEDAIPSAVTDLSHLQYLNISHNRLSGTIPFGFSKLQPNFSLVVLDLAVDLSQNRLVGNIPNDMLQNLAGCPSFNLSHNFLNGSIPEVTRDSCFNTLDLSYNNLSGDIPSNLFPASYYLWLQNNRLRGDINKLLVNGSYAVDLRLQNNLLTGDLSGIINMDHVYMIVVDLSNNNLRWSTSAAILDPIKATLDNLNRGHNLGYGLEQVRLGGNNFSGTYLSKACLRNITQLAVLDLSNSHLKGEMPGSTFSSSCLPSLRLFNISYNDIGGAVPEEIFKLPSLQALDLSNNNLSGPIPPMPPNSTLFSRQIFAGNVGLCGFPLDPCSLGAAGGVHWWVLLVTTAGSLTIALGSCFAATWRWRVYQKRHQQDADLINTLLERDSAALMSLREIKKATANFAKSAQIGEGGFGTVYIGKLNDGTMVAIKRSKGEGSERDKEQFLNEVKILSQVNHRNLVKLLGCCLENKTAVLVFEFVSNGTLQEHLQGKIGADRLSWKQRLNIAVQTANALNYLHASTTSPIFHRDVKSANILLTDDFDAKVADFGISKLAPLQATHLFTRPDQGTLGYMDPEYFTTWRLTEKSDVFSFGVVLLELISAKPALDFSRGGDDNSLVNFASSHINREDLHELIDPALIETYSDPAGHESILNVGRLAMDCVELRSKARPTMNKIWKDLQNLWVELNRIREDGDHDEEDDEAPRPDHMILLSKSFFGDSSSCKLQSDSSGIQLSEQCGPASFRSKHLGK